MKRRRTDPRELEHTLGDNTRMLNLISRFTRVERRRIDSRVVEMIFTARDCSQGGDGVHPAD